MNKVSQCDPSYCDCNGEDAVYAATPEQEPVDVALMRRMVEASERQAVAMEYVGKMLAGIYVIASATLELQEPTENEDDFRDLYEVVRSKVTDLIESLL